MKKINLERRLTFLRKALYEKCAQEGIMSFEFFAKKYFSRFFDTIDSVMHREFYKELPKVKKDRSYKIALAAPRGSAKTTLISQIYILWRICTETANYILLLSDTKVKASDFLSTIKDELVNNEDLRECYPHVCEVLGMHQVREDGKVQ